MLQLMKKQILNLNLPMRNIPYGNNYLETSDFNYVKKVLNSNFITNGPYVHKFEDSLKSFFSTRYVLTTSSGTSGKGSFDLRAKYKIEKLAKGQYQICI